MQLKKRYLAKRLIIIIGISLSTISCISRTELSREYYRIAQDMFLANQYQQALNYFRKADALSPAGDRGGFNVALIYLSNSNYEAAQQSVSLLLAKDPENTEVWELQAYIYYQQGNHIAALAIYEWMLSQDVIKDRVVRNASHLHWERYNATAVIELYALLTPPISSALQWEYIQALTLEGRVEEALSAAKDYRRELDPEALADLGDWYEQIGDFENVLTVLDELLELNPDDADILFRKSKILLVERVDFTLGVETLQQAMDQGFSDQQQLDALQEEALFDKEAVLRIIAP